MDPDPGSPKTCGSGGSESGFGSGSATLLIRIQLYIAWKGNVIVDEQAFSTSRQLEDSRGVQKLTLDGDGDHFCVHHCAAEAAFELHSRK